MRKHQKTTGELDCGTNERKFTKQRENGIYRRAATLTPMAHSLTLLRDFPRYLKTNQTSCLFLRYLAVAAASYRIKPLAWLAQPLPSRARHAIKEVIKVIQMASIRQIRVLVPRTLYAEFDFEATQTPERIVTVAEDVLATISSLPISKPSSLTTHGTSLVRRIAGSMIHQKIDIATLLNWVPKALQDPR
jgi:hypothetical protein